MPSPSVIIKTAVSPGDLIIMRNAYRTSCRTELMPSFVEHCPCHLNHLKSYANSRSRCAVVGTWIPESNTEKPASTARVARGSLAGIDSPMTSICHLWACKPQVRFAAHRSPVLGRVDSTG